jgi:hypothetical protein
MATITLPSSPYGKKLSVKSNKIRDFTKPILQNHARFYVRLDQPQRGGQKLGKLQKIRGVFIGQDDYLYVGFRLADAEAGDTTRYVRFAKLTEADSS